MNITFNIIYCTENQSVVNNFIRDLGGENVHFKLLPAQNESLVRQTLNESGNNILLVTDNFLKNEGCLSNAYRNYQLALKQKSLTCIVADGFIVENDGHITAIPTRIEHVSQMMQYLNYWQEKYLLAKRQYGVGEISEAAHSSIKSISSDLGAFLQLLRDSGFYYFENLTARNYQQFCQLMGIPQPPSEGRAPFEPPTLEEQQPVRHTTEIETGESFNKGQEPESLVLNNNSTIFSGVEIEEKREKSEAEPIEKEPQKQIRRASQFNEIDEEEFFGQQSGKMNQGSNIDEIVEEVLSEEEEEERIQNSDYDNMSDEKKSSNDDDDDMGDLFVKKEQRAENSSSIKSNVGDHGETVETVQKVHKKEVFSVAGQTETKKTSPRIIDFRLKTIPFVSQFESKNTVASMDENQSVKKDLEQVYSLAKSGNLVAAASQLANLLTANPENVDVHFLCGEIAELQRNYSQARYHYEKVAELAPFYPKVYHKLSWLCLNHFSEEKKIIKSYFKQAMALDDNNPQLLYAYAEFLNDSGDTNKAIKYFKKVLSANPAHPFANYDLALIYHQAGDFALANRYYIEACENNEELSTAENDLAFTSYSVLDVERAGEAINLHSLEEEEKMQPVQSEIEWPQNIELMEENELADRLSNESEKELYTAKKTAEVNKYKPQNGAKIVLVTGASAGIGRATAEIFARNGYNLILTARREDRLIEMQNYFHSHYSGGCIILDFDVRDYKSIEMTFRNLDKDWRSVDILINNAGLAIGMDPIHEGDPSHWDTMIDTNIKGLLYMTRVISPGMVERRSGHIINLCSTAGKEAYPNGNVYSATKFAVESLTKNMRIDLHKYGIRVGQVSPGAVEETEFSQVRFLGDKEKAAKIYEGFVPLKASDIAEIVYFMATTPSHVNIQDVLVMGTQQASATIIDRSGR